MQSASGHTWPTSAELAREALSLARLAMPLVFAMLGNIAITTTDMLMLGQVGPHALAAVSLALSLFHPLLLLGIGIGLAVTPLATSALVARQPRKLRRTVRQGIWAAIPFVLLCAPPLWYSADLFHFIGQNAEISELAETYTRAIWPGFFFILLMNVIRSYLTALEKTRSVLVVTLMAVPLNAALNYVLIFGAGPIPALGVMGAGMGSSLTNMTIGIALAIHVATQRPFRRHALFARFWRSDWQAFFAVHKLGIPIGLMIVLEVAAFGASAQIVGLVGVDALAAHQIALQLASITFMVPLGIGQAATAAVGLATSNTSGRQSVQTTGWAALALSTLFMATAAIIFLTIPETLIRPFLNESASSATVMALAVTYLAWAAAFQIVDGLQVTAAHILRGLQDTRVPMWIAGFGYWAVGMPLAAWLALATDRGGEGVWIGFAAGLSVCALFLVRRFHKLTAQTL